MVMEQMKLVIPTATFKVEYLLTQTTERADVKPHVLPKMPCTFGDSFVVLSLGYACSEAQSNYQEVQAELPDWAAEINPRESRELR